MVNEFLFTVEVIHRRVFGEMILWSTNLRLRRLIDEIVAMVNGFLPTTRYGTLYPQKY